MLLCFSSSFSVCRPGENDDEDEEDWVVSG
jgi:hypothetical protein